MPDIRYRFVESGISDVLGAFRSADRAAKDYERTTRQRASTSRAAASAETKQQQEVERASSRAQRKLERDAAVAERLAKRTADTEIREAQRAATAKAKAHEHVFQVRQRYEAEQRRMEERRATAERRAAARTSDSRWATAGRLGKDVAFAGAGAVAAGLGIVGGAAREGMRLQDLSNRLSINARGAGEQGVDATRLRKEFEAAALQAPGVKAADIAEGAAGFVAKTGRLDVARNLSSTFATTASATGADVQDIANAAADIFQKFDVSGINEMRDALAALTFQGKAGAFELKDAASQFAKISAAAERFGVAKGAQGLRVLGGLTQIARTATGSPEQAATSVEAMFRQVIAKSKELGAVGASPFVKGSSTKTRDIRDVLVDAISKNKGSLPKLQKIFGEEGIRAVSPLISTYNQAEQTKAGTGVTALREALEKAIDAPGNWSEVVKDAAQAQRSSSAQLDAAWEQLKVNVSARVIPALVELVPKLTKLIDGADPLITVFEALVYSGGLVVDLFKTLGLVKEKSPEEKLDKAQKDLVAFNESLGTSVPTAADVAKRSALEAAVATADQRARGLTGAEDKGKTLTKEAFAQRYAELGGGTAEERQAALTGARGLANKISGGTASPYLEMNDSLQGFLGENQEQQRLRQRFQGDAAYEQGKTGGADEMKAAAEKLAAAATKLDAAAGKQGNAFNGGAPGAATFAR